MHRLIPIICALLLLASVASADQPTIVAQPGWVIFDPTKGGGYRYGPSIMVGPNNHIDVWFASPGGQGADGSHEWDWIRHRDSVDGGHTWSPETVVLKPDPASRDRQSVCDPGVIRLGDFYYLGVTAVEDSGGMCNEVFVARSHSPTGPFEKWNGTGWGGLPMPILPFRSPADVWGLGEPSFVRVDRTLFVYYTEISDDDHGKKINRTRVATAPADASDWPAHLTDKGVAFDRLNGEDSVDVKYDQTSGQFLAVNSADRMGPKAHINFRWSTDGLKFGPAARVAGPTMYGCHNVGVSGTADGHLLPDHKNFIAYAYSNRARPDPSWGFWCTYLNPIEIKR